MADLYVPGIGDHHWGEVEIGAIYRHYKGEYYRVRDIHKGAGALGGQKDEDHREVTYIAYEAVKDPSQSYVRRSDEFGAFLYGSAVCRRFALIGPDLLGRVIQELSRK